MICYNYVVVKLPREGISADTWTAAVVLQLMFCSNTSLYYWSHISAVMYCAKGGVTVKRVKAACIFQTLCFSQKPEMGYSKEQALEINQQEINHYKATLERAKTRYQIVDTVNQEDGSIIIRVRKQYNDKADVSEYFE